MHHRRSLQRVFQQSFTVEDIARPLLSFDAGAPAEHVRQLVEARGDDVAGLRSEGAVTAYVTTADLTTGLCRDFAHPIESSAVVGGDLPLADLVLRLRNEPRLFVSAFGGICGVVGRPDLLQPPARMWLFGMITLLELRFGAMIERLCPGDSWKASLSDGRIDKAEALQAERSKLGRRPKLAGCLQFADKVRIIAQNEHLRAMTRFESKSQIEEVGKRLERLRNNLAHAQDIVTDDWDTIASLAENLNSIVETSTVD